MGFYQNYRKAVSYINPELEPDFLLAGAFFLSAVGLTYVGLFIDLMLGGLLAVLLFDVAVGYPLYKRAQRISQMESVLPDVLSHMGTTLKAGGTIESALKEVAKAGYGPMADELSKMIREIKEGKTFEDALMSFAERSESMPIKRSVNVIISAKRTGGGLVSALLSIADDLRAAARLKRERTAKTMVQVLFIIIAADIVAPLIFGLVSGIMLFLGGIGGTEVPPLFSTIIFYFKAYLAVSAVFSALAASMIREGNITKTVIYAPVLLVVTYIIFMVVSGFANTFFAV